MLVPGARNLHWRYEVLHANFVSCKQKVAAGEPLNVNLEELVGAAKSLWPRLKKGQCPCTGQANASEWIHRHDFPRGRPRQSREDYSELLLQDYTKHCRLSRSATTDRPLPIWHASRIRGMRVCDYFTQSATQCLAPEVVQNSSE